MPMSCPQSYQVDVLAANGKGRCLARPSGVPATVRVTWLSVAGVYARLHARLILEDLHTQRQFIDILADRNMQLALPTGEPDIESRVNLLVAASDPRIGC